MMQPSDRGQHCPFLNRTDSRCGSHFTLERLEHAFAYCFDRYHACSTYLELLVERRVRRGEIQPEEVPVGEVCVGEVGSAAAGKSGQQGMSHVAKPLVELTIHAKPRPEIAGRIVPASAAPNRAA